MHRRARRVRVTAPRRPGAYAFNQAGDLQLEPNTLNNYKLGERIMPLENSCTDLYRPGSLLCDRKC